METSVTSRPQACVGAIGLCILSNDETEEHLLMKARVAVQVDTNTDRLVSLGEFIAATQNQEFLEKDEWEVRALIKMHLVSDGERLETL